MPRRVLFVTYAYPPRNTPGAMRAFRMAKYLPEFGWIPVVLCPEWTPKNCLVEYDEHLAKQASLLRTVRVPLRAANTFWCKAWRVFQRRFMPYYWPLELTRSMLACGQDLLRGEQFQALWSTYKPGQSHWVAAQLSRKHSIPWVADFRDLPDQAGLTLWSGLEVISERLICRRANALVTVCEPLAKALRGRHRASVRVITNGYDPADFEGIKQVRSHRKFSIGYFGSLYKGRNPGPLLAAIDLLIKRPGVRLEDICVNFYGPPKDRVSAISAGFLCQQSVVWHPRVSHEVSLRHQQEALVLLLLVDQDARDVVVTAKVFEYLGARRPILNVPGGNIAKALLTNTGAGVSAGSPEDIAGILGAWYDEWKRTGTVLYRGDTQKVARYSCREQARQLADVLESVIGSRAQLGQADIPTQDES